MVLEATDGRRRCPPTQRQEGDTGNQAGNENRAQRRGRSLPFPFGRLARNDGRSSPAPQGGRARQRKSDGCAWLKKTVDSRGRDGWTWLGDTVARWGRDGDGVFLRAMAAFFRRRPSAARPASAPLSPPAGPGAERPAGTVPKGRGRSPSACLGAERPEMRTRQGCRRGVRRERLSEWCGLIGWCGC